MQYALEFVNIKKNKTQIVPWKEKQFKVYFVDY